jgi:Photosynthetic reaction centre cytochrome C subunit
MTLQTITLSFAAVVFAFGFAALNWRVNGAMTVTQQEEKPVEQVQKNIQVLKGMPSSQLLPVMHFMRTSLGVRCDYCHVAENGKYWMDDKPAKQTARKMLQMVFEINRANFAGRAVVTCNSCHRGQTKPVAVPVIGQGAFTNTTIADADAKPLDALPTAEHVFDKYLQALGGKAAIEKIRTRLTTAVLLRPKLINSGTPRASILNRGETWTIETFQKAPDKYLAVIKTADGVIYQGFNGTVGWTKTASGQRELSNAEVLRIKRQADLYKDLKLKEQYSTTTVIGRERIEDHEAYVIEAISLDNKTEKLFFDTGSGLLRRRTVFTQTKLGLDPEQTDYEDYREVDGMWLPFIVRVSYLDDNHYGTTRKLTDVKQNLPIDDSRFDMPTAPK